MLNNPENLPCKQHRQKLNCPSHDDFLENVLNELCATYADGKGVNASERVLLPACAEVVELIQDLFEIMAPGYTEARRYTERSLHYALGNVLSHLYDVLLKLISRSILHLCALQNEDCRECEVGVKADQIVRDFLSALPALRESLKQDAQAAYDGDPAAVTEDEILVSYPGIRALMIQRMAHKLHVHHVPFLPRMMTEYIHATTGIDIHPGAQLGNGIFIDHGTGVVIGETSVLGNGIKIYQGVTLGALSFPKDACGKLIRGTKRHPTIEDNVTLYAGATVLGNVIVGEHSVIGGNVWLTESVPPHSKITVSPSLQHVSTLH